ncbi:hypothetical protein NEMBOFW57_008928 [Staphylotrichum longicolle]|uniref:Ribonuclease H2 subunit B n=1 Tax=Staphylotrichum longicolle TaxID=669026 RepID=A0AAD4ES56_9PEZI|nr:hypothetical protein NEMBOFW57_008928 [Staphylotrichum longicolle]
MARTRSKGATAPASKGDKKTSSSSSTNNSSSSVYSLPACSTNPPKLFILPKTASSSARVFTLHHPRYNKPTRYLVCPSAGFFEFTTVSPPKSAPRSWLIQPTTSTITTTTTTTTTNDEDSNNNNTTQTIQSPALHLATPYDPLFLLLPALFSSSTTSSSSPTSPTTHQPQEKQKRMFLSLEDHLDALPDPARHLADILHSTPSAREAVEARLRAVCDVVQAGDESMYRVSEARVVREVLGKARRMVQGGEGSLPGSMEERFVRRELEAPVVGGSVASTETVGSLADSQVSTASTAATSVTDGEGIGGGEVSSAMTASEKVVKLQRLRVAFNFICSSYIAPAIAEMLKGQLAKETDLVDFKPLDEYLAQLAKLRQEAAAARTTDFSRKRMADEEADERAEKRRKMEAEEKAKKASMSRGVKNLMKVNTSGMKKMSDFFKKKA